MRGRPTTQAERQLLVDMLSRHEDGEALLEQLDLARVVSSCRCGCGSLGFVFPERRQGSAPPARLFPVEGTVVDDEGERIGGLILFLRDGRLHDLEVTSFETQPLPLPEASHVRWDDP